jgi:hypothetical protein
MRRIGMAALAVVAAIACASGAHAQAPSDTLNVFDGNIVWPNNAATQLYSGGPLSSGTVAPYTARQLATVSFANNDSVNPGLHADAFNINAPRWDPQPGSPALCQSGGSTIVNYPDPWFQKAYYIGAVAPRTFAGEDWTTGWTYYNNVGGAGRTDINYAKPLITLSGTLTTRTLTPANNYLLQGKVNVAPGHTLTIQAGTVLFGESATIGYLVIDRGAKIMALGTREQPIIMTSDKSPGSMAPGDNGGWVIHGRALANCANTAAGDSCVSEGGAGAYGGPNDNDDSGIIRYVRIEYAGKEVAPNNELNALTMNAVGRNTTIEYVQAHLGSDDGLEWFGGTARCRNLISTGCQDDNVDWQLGFRGFLQFICVQQHPGQGDGGIEADNSEFGANNQPRSHPVIANLTLVGAPTGGAGTTNRGALMRRGTAFYVINSIFTGWRGPALAMADAATFHRPGPPPSILCTPGVTAVEAEATTLPGRLRSVASPNPSFGMADIGFYLDQPRHVRIQIFDVSGRLVDTIANQPMPRGSHAVRWSSERRESGTFYYRITTDDGQTSTGKLTHLK